jgi:raffinose/stachyose/melibiose transport system substrate-binding protein
MKKALSLLFCVVLVFGILASSGCSNSKEPAKAAQRKFTFCTPFTDKQRTAVVDEVIAKLKVKYPNYKFENDTSSDYAQKYKLSFASGNGYAMVYVDDLNQQTLQKDGYLMDLTKYVTENGWVDQQVVGVVAFNNLRTPGKYYSVPMLMAPIVVYYNKDIFNRLNLTVPKTVAQLEDVMKTVKSNGLVPMESAKDNIPGWILESLILNSAPKADVNDWYYLKNNSDTMKSAFLTAATYLQNWASNGYFTKGYEGTSSDSVPQLFGQGKTAMVVDGDWQIPQYELTKLNIGAFAFPAFKEGDTDCIVNSTDGAWALNAKLNADDTKVGIDFIKEMTSQDMAKEWTKLGLTTTINGDYSGVAVSQIRQNVTSAIKGTTIGFYLDNVKPGYLDTMDKEISLLETKASTPQVFSDHMNKIWSAK